MREENSMKISDSFAFRKRFPENVSSYLYHCGFVPFVEKKLHVKMGMKLSVCTSYERSLPGSFYR